MDFSFVTIPASIIILTVTFQWLVFLLASLKYRSPLQGYRSTKQEGSLTYSVIIPAHNEMAVIHDVITDFLVQTHKNLEVIAVCHNCTDKTLEVTKKIKDERLRIIKLETTESGKAHALNAALKHAQGDIIVQMDADNRVNSNFLSKANQYFSNPSVKAVQAKVATKNPSLNLLTKCQQLEYELLGMPYWEGRNTLGQSCTIGGTGVLFRRSVLESVRGWDNELIEDYDLYCKLKINGISVIYASNLECYDEKPPYWTGIVKQRARWIRGHFSVMNKRLFENRSLVDFVYMISPLYYIAWYSCSFLVTLYLLSSYLGFTITYWYVPAFTWLVSLTTMYGIFAFRLVRQRNFHDLVYLPIHFVFSFHWLIAFLKSLTVKSWSQTKTEHGYTTG